MSTEPPPLVGLRIPALALALTLVVGLGVMAWTFSAANPYSCHGQNHRAIAHMETTAHAVTRHDATATFDAWENCDTSGYPLLFVTSRDMSVDQFTQSLKTRGWTARNAAGSRLASPGSDFVADVQRVTIGAEHPTQVTFVLDG